jgi:hypothetical protein
MYSSENISGISKQYTVSIFKAEMMRMDEGYLCRKCHCHLINSVLKMKMVCSSEMPEKFYAITWHQNPEDITLKLYTDNYENPKS